MDTGKGMFELMAEGKAEQVPEEHKERIDSSRRLNNRIRIYHYRSRIIVIRIFRVGEIVEIRSSRFRIERIDKKKMTLKLLPRLKANENRPS